MEVIKWIPNRMPPAGDSCLHIMDLNEVQKAEAFHKSFPQYSVTPLVSLDHMAEYLGLGKIFVKDESYRFGLNAFKVLGGSFAMARYIAKELHKDVSELPYEVLISDKLRNEFGQATFYTATDGNHGRGIAWAANKLGQKSVVLMPKGTTKTRLDNILAEHATASIEDVNYDECVRMANAMAMKTTHGIMIQDTAWENYEEIPSWIMQGYGTMALEADTRIHDKGVEPPTHIFIQAGVGSLAGAVQGYFANRYPDHPPKVIVVEADQAACLYKGAVKGDGSIQFVEGDMPTIMAGLACGEPNTLSWNILKNHADTFTAVSDTVAAKGMRMLAAPLKGDPPVTSGESGAAGFGTLACIMKMEQFKDLREHLNLNANSRVLLFSTEGDTDPDRYKSIVWDGNEH